MNNSASNDSKVAFWESLFASRSWGKYPPLPLVRCVARRFGQPGQLGRFRALELGCGPGANLWFLAREGFTVSGIDGSPSGIAQAKAKMKAEGLEVCVDELRVGDFSKAEFSPGSFDFIADVESLYANEREVARSTVLSALAWLKPGGIFFSMTFEAGTTSNLRNDGEFGPAGIPSDGPLCGTGYARLSNDADLAYVYNHESLVLLDRELHTRQLRDGSQIREWSLELQKCAMPPAEQGK